MFVCVFPSNTQFNKIVICYCATPAVGGAVKEGVVDPRWRLAAVPDSVRSVTLTHR